MSLYNFLGEVNQFWYRTQFGSNSLLDDSISDSICCQRHLAAWDENKNRRAAPQCWKGNKEAKNFQYGQCDLKESNTMYWAVQKNLVKGCRQTLDCYCVSCELLSASIADALWFVNMVCLPLIAERNAHEICLTQECLQIVRHLLWKRTTTHSLRNNNPMFYGNLWPNPFEQPSTSFGIHSQLLPH